MKTLTSKEGKILHQQIVADVRKSIFMRINAHLTQKVTQELAHLGLSEATQDQGSRQSDHEPAE